MNRIIKNKIITLVETLNKHNDLYFVEGTPSISDAEYDELYLKLKVLEKKYPEYVFENSPTQSVRILKERTNFVERETPMLSLNKCFKGIELLKFISKSQNQIKSKNCDLIVQHKIDGVAFEVIYKNGCYVKSLTRGNGFLGEDITKKIDFLLNLPKNIPIKEYIEVRGELYITKSDFNKLNQIKVNNNEIPFKNTRNTVAAILKMEDNKYIKYLSYMVYSVGKNYLSFLYEEEVLTYLKNANFNVIDCLLISSNTDFLLNLFNKALNSRPTLNYDIDGLVYKLNNRQFQKILGFNNKYYNYAIAYKFPSTMGETKVLSITSSISKNGTITPVANLKEISLGSVLIKRASLYNFNYITSIDLRIGDYVILERSGDVIPKIFKILYDKRTTEQKEYTPPTKCSSCNSDLIKSGAYLMCLNKYNCQAQLINHITHLVSKDCFNIQNLSHKKIKQLVSHNILNSLLDIFFINNAKERVLSLKGFNNKSFNDLVKNIESSKNILLHKLIISLNIPTIGNIKAKKISQFITLNKINLEEDNSLSKFLFNYTTNSYKSKLIDQIGSNSVDNLTAFIRNSNNYYLVTQLVSINKIIPDNLVEKSKGNVVITGSFRNYTRKQIKDILNKLNYTVVNSINSKTEFLIKGEKPGSKLNKAIKLNIRIITEYEFINQFIKSEDKILTTDQN